MDRDAIIREWFYRLPKGYANAPYSKDEMYILHKILEENGLNGSVFIKEVDQLDQAFNNAEPVEEEDLEEAPKAKGSRLAFSKRERETLTDKSIEDIISLLSSPDADIPKAILSRISKLLVRSGAGENVIRERLEDILGRDANRTDDILDIILDGKTDEAKFGAYLANRTISYTAFLNRPANYYSVFKSTGISQQALGDLIEYKWSANPNLGIAEVALAILLKDGSRPTKKGDLAVGGKPFEVGGI